MGLSIIAGESSRTPVNLEVETEVTNDRLPAGEVSSGNRYRQMNPLDAINSIFNKMMREAGLGSKMPRWTYYKHGPIAFCYNTEPFTIDRDQPRKWAAWCYRVNKAKGTWKRIGKKVWFAKRKKAAARALKWYEKAKARSTARKEAAKL